MIGWDDPILLGAFRLAAAAADQTVRTAVEKVEPIHGFMWCATCNGDGGLYEPCGNCGCDGRVPINPQDLFAAAFPRWGWGDVDEKVQKGFARLADHLGGES
jgi:hypothetical protein